MITLFVASDKWSAKINGTDTKILESKFTSDSFTLAVRYISNLNINSKTVFQSVSLSIY